ncbi:peptidyl-prolyl cis-trans isomerase [Bacteroidia bacterium]|nr:peptidyl-prolyl cis-trans isomerase [Bacteroidia bacterium]
MSESCLSANTYSIHTSLGTIKIKLYDKTPLHQANFEKLVKEHAYDGVLFHRIIESFMIQTGDLSTKQNPITTEGEMIPAEFVPEYIHKKGALAAARTGDAVNPEKKSSFSQFYIVQGRPFTEEELFSMEDFGEKVWTPEQKAVYKTLGGTPFLDQEYTVFGEVVEGLDIVDAIAAVQTDARDYPQEDIRIVSIKGQ